jgi:fructosamine-3-kinase
MFGGEFASLNAIADVVPDLCPRGVAWGQIDDEEDDVGGRATGRWFLATEFLELGGSRGAGKSLARKLAKLHATPAPAPPAAGLNDNMGDIRGQDEDGPLFGFPVPTFCGDVKQPNRFRCSWADFYANQRLMTVLAEAERRNGSDKGLRDLVEKTAQQVVPRLLGDRHLGYDMDGRGEGIIPVVVHGDLWRGNTGRGRILRATKASDVGDVVFDPSACYAHSEFELGIMNMFGGFGRDFFDEYHRLLPKTEPVEEYEDRVSLYEL